MPRSTGRASCKCRGMRRSPAEPRHGAERDIDEGFRDSRGNNCGKHVGERRVWGRHRHRYHPAADAPARPDSKSRLPSARKVDESPRECDDRDDHRFQRSVEGGGEKSGSTETDIWTWALICTTWRSANRPISPSATMKSSGGSDRQSRRERPRERPRGRSIPAQNRQRGDPAGKPRGVLRDPLVSHPKGG